MSDDERWILQDDCRGHARVWKRDDAGVSLALRTSVKFPTFAPDDRLFGIEGANDRRLVVIDLATLEVHRFDRAEAYGVVGHHLYVADETSVRRYAWPSLDPKGAVASTIEMHPSASAFREIGDTFVVGEALVAFDRAAPPSVLATGLRFFGASRDGKRVVACGDAGRMKVLDTTTGDAILSIDAAKTAVCNWSFPGLSPDGRFVVAVEEKMTKENWRRMVTVTWNVATKTATRRLDPKMIFSTALDAEVDVEDGAPPRVCVGYGNMHWHRTECPWVLAASGALAPAPKLAPKADEKSAAEKALAKKLPDLRIAEATSPDGTTRVIATAKEGEGDGAYERLTLHVVDEATLALVRSIEVAHDPFHMLLSAHDGESPPTLRFLDATHALFESHSFPPARFVLDATTGAFDAIDPSATSLHGRFVLVDDALVDLLSHARSALTATPAQCAAAPSVQASTP